MPTCPSVEVFLNFFTKIASSFRTSCFVSIEVWLRTGIFIQTPTNRSTTSIASFPPRKITVGSNACVIIITYRLHNIRS